jgi:hypothetical protein
VESGSVTPTAEAAAHGTNGGRRMGEPLNP